MTNADAIFAACREELAETEAKLRRHPYVAALEEGRIARPRLRLFAGEQFHIISGDLRGMGHLVSRFWGRVSGPLFLGGVQAEQAALEALLPLAAALEMTQEDLEAHEPLAGAHAYGAYMAWLAHYGEDAQVAAAFAVNFPAWGENCGRIGAALRSRYGMTTAQVRFFELFAAPAPGLADTAATIIEAALARGVSARLVKRAVRLLQDYELMFWETLWEASR
ncbi:MAG: transcriptional regulator [Candidatus Tectomicrobia bacterium]|nr:transcriptional regulator [Candidatus Tectomicrobia bacterium]